MPRTADERPVRCVVSGSLSLGIGLEWDDEKLALHTLHVRPESIAQSSHPLHGDHMDPAHRIDHRARFPPSPILLWKYPPMSPGQSGVTGPR